MIGGVLRIGLLVAIGIAIVASVTAQERSARVPAADKDKLVVTGCVQRADQLATGTSGTVGAAGEADSSKFILTKAAPAKSQAPAASRTYRLDADDSLLTTHVGQKVEITGTLDDPRPSAAGDPIAASGGSKLKVTSVKMIAAACSE